MTRTRPHTQDPFRKVAARPQLLQYPALIAALPLVALYRRLIEPHLVEALVRHKLFGRGQPAAEREQWARQIVTIIVDELIHIGQGNRGKTTGGPPSNSQAPAMRNARSQD